MRVPFRITVIGICFAALGMAACQPEPSPSAPIRPIKAMQISDSQAMAQKWLPGRAKAAREVDLSFRVNGDLVDFDIQVGDEVKAGDVLARLDPAQFTATVNSAKASLARAQAELTNAEIELERSRTLVERGTVAQARLDRDEASVNVAKANVASAEAALTSAQLNMKYTNLTAPFGGVIVATYVDNFESIQAKQQVLRLLDSSRIEMVIDLPEQFMSTVQAVENIRVEFDAYPDLTLSAEIIEVGREASAGTRTYPVTLGLDQPESVRIEPGMSGRATADPTEGMDSELVARIQVPSTAVVIDTTGAAYVWVVEQLDGDRVGSVIRRDVRTGTITDFGIQVIEGLEAGEWVVTGGAHTVQAGQRVRVAPVADVGVGS